MTSSLLFIALFVYVWMVSGLIVSFMMLILSLTVWPCSKSLYRKICYHLAYLSWSQFVFLGQYWSKCNLRLFVNDGATKTFFGKEHSLVVMNHNKDIDWVMSWLMADAYGVLGGAKVFAKAMVKYVPIIGWQWAFSEYIFLNRDWNKDKDNITNSLDAIAAYPDNYFVTLLIYAEGTRFTEKKHQASIEFANSRGIKPLKHHLLPRPKGFVACVRNLKGKVPAMYDVTVAFSDNQENEPTIKNLLYGKGSNAQIYLRRILIEDIPCDTDKECTDWLMKLYREKDEVYENFVQNDGFTIGEEIPITPRPHSVIIMMTWTLLIGSISLYYLFNIVIYGSWYANLAILLFMLLSYVGAKLMISVTESGKGSTYGSSPKHVSKVISEPVDSISSHEKEN